MLSTRDGLEIQRHKEVKNQRMVKDISNSNQKRAGVIILSDKIGFKLKKQSYKR